MSDLSERLPVPRSVTDLMMILRVLTMLSAELGRRTLGKQ